MFFWIVGLLAQKFQYVILTPGVLILVFLDSGSSGRSWTCSGGSICWVLILVFLDSGSSGVKYTAEAKVKLGS